MEAYKPLDIVKDFELSKPLIKLLCEAKETYGEYKGYLKSMSFDYKFILESFSFGEREIIKLIETYHFLAMILNY